jgi:pyruvate formate lyase activating enzyme
MAHIFFEYAYDIAKLAHKSGLFTTIVSTVHDPEAVDLIAPYIDAITVDIKGGASSDFTKNSVTYKCTTHI